ncbi:hypothetical protein RCL1_006164 [Eukaryota sp. TZLM3-RCL]
MFGVLNTIDELRLAVHLEGTSTHGSLKLIAPSSALYFEGPITPQIFESISRALNRSAPEYKFKLNHKPTVVELEVQLQVDNLWVRFALPLTPLRENPINELFSLFSNVSESLTQCQAQKSSIEMELSSMKTDLDEMRILKDKLVGEFKEYEQELYAKFFLLLNEKKQKISSLVEALNELKPVLEEQQPDLKVEFDEGTPSELPLEPPSVAGSKRGISALKSSLITTKRQRK